MTSPASHSRDHGIAPVPDHSYAEEVDDDLDLSDRRFRPTRLTVILVALILIAAGFAGGVLIQKDRGTTAAGAGARTGGFSGQGFPGGGEGFPGAGTGRGSGGGTEGFPGGAAPDAGTGSGATGSGGAAASATPVVVGTVTQVSGSTLTVRNFAGKSVTVKVPSGATVTMVAGKTLTTLTKGVSVSVTGTTSSAGDVTATSVTVRS